jgi:hypothetical protein
MRIGLLGVLTGGQTLNQGLVRLQKLSKVSSTKRLLYNSAEERMFV